MLSQRAKRQLSERPTWKTVMLGRFASADELNEALISASYLVHVSCEELFKKLVVAVEPTSVELVRVTVAELGFRKVATREQIYEAGLEVGWNICPAEIGPELRLQYPDQPAGESVHVAMNPERDLYDRPSVFYVARDGYFMRVKPRKGLYVSSGHPPGNLWSYADLWAFQR